MVLWVTEGTGTVQYISCLHLIALQPGYSANKSASMFSPFKFWSPLRVYLTSKTSHRQQIYVLNLIVSVLWGKFKSREWRRTPVSVCDDLTKEWELWKLSVIIDRYSLFTITMIRCQHATHWRAGDRGGQISVRNPIHLRLSLKTAHPQQAHQSVSYISQS